MQTEVHDVIAPIFEKHGWETGVVGINVDGCFMRVVSPNRDGMIVTLVECRHNGLVICCNGVYKDGPKYSDPEFMVKVEQLARDQ